MRFFSRLEDIFQCTENEDYVRMIMDFLRSSGYASLVSGEKRKLSNDLSVVYISKKGDDENKNILELHRKYADLHYTISGTDRIAFKPVSECKTIRKPYIDEEDYMLFSEMPATVYEIETDSFCFISPEFAHMALYGNCGAVEKLVFKIPVA